MEVKKLVDEVKCMNGGLTSNGTLRLTDFHLIFSGPPPERSDQHATPANNQKPRESWITYPMISQCTLRPMPSASGMPSSIRLGCRDFIFVTFFFKDDKVAREVYDIIKSRTCKLPSVQQLYAFKHKPSKAEQEVNGWDHYDAKAEFKRQGISEKASDKGWRITWINKDYSFCDTYPSMLVVPSSISDNVLKYAKVYRSRHRVPVLSYLHPVNNCSITRSSQPLSGLTKKVNPQDERLVAASFSASVPPGSNNDSEPLPPPPPSQTSTIEAQLTESEKFEDSFISNAPAMFDKTGKRLIYGAQQRNLIVDARPTLNAMVNQFQGMGSEVMEKYPSASKIFLNIENIHYMRDSLRKVVDAIKDADVSPLPPAPESLAASDWLKHTRAVLDGSSIIARQVGISHSHVLIHCSDGWDRTSQLSALSQIMLDPHYRTIDGFITLVEKDWLSFGHMFRLRSGPLNHDNNFTIQRDGMAGSTVHPGDDDGRNDTFKNAWSSAAAFFKQKSDPSDVDLATAESSSSSANEEATVPKMVSPVFHQFLDCLYQMVRQNPNRFEFNERFLRRLLYHLYSCQYGTFLYNSEKQRVDARVAERTSSVWDYFLSRKPEFTNKEFDPVTDDHQKGRERLLLPDLDNIRWWHQLFNRTDEEMNASLNAAAAAQLNKVSALAKYRPAGDGRDDSHIDTAPDGESASNPSGLPQSQSVLVAVETAHETLTPQRRDRQFRKSASAENPNAVAAITQGIATNIGRGVSNALSNFGGGAGRTGSPNSGSGAPVRTEQELQQMT